MPGMTPLTTTNDRWMVSIGRWHFGPLDFDQAVAFEREHGGKKYPLWLPPEVDAMSGDLAVECAKREVAS